MKYFWGYLFLFLAFLVLLVALVRPDLLEQALTVTGAVLITLGYMLIAAAAGVFIVGGALLAWWWWKRSTVESLRQRDGHYPIQRVRVKGGRTVFIDPNQTIGPAIMVDRNTGEIYEHEPAAGWHIQATIRGMVEQTRRAQAMFQGDASRSSVHGSQHKGDRITAAAAKLTAGGYDKKQGVGAFEHSPAVDSIAAPVLEAPRPLTVRDGFNCNTNTSLALGQTADGRVVMWNMLDTPHLRFHGKTQGSGKTNALQTVAAGAARLGAHVIVLDRRRFKDWGEFRGIAELVDSSDPRRFAAAVLALRNIYQDRDRLLGQHGAPNIQRLPVAPKRIVAVVSEFGALCEVAAGEGVLADVLGPLKLIMREAGATGVHVLLEDQAADKWPMGIAANAEPVTGYLPLNYGAAGGYHYAHKLEPYQFHFAGAVFKSWHMGPVLRDVLAAAPDVGEPIVTGRSVHSVGERQGGYPEVEATERSTERATERPEPNAEPAGPTDLQETVWAWRDANPNGSQADMRRAFEVQGITIARGYAHECWHKWPGPKNKIDLSTEAGRAAFAALSKDAKLSTGERLGTDITGGA